MDLSPTHFHLLLNHFPTIGFIIGLGLFVASLFANSAHLKQASLAIFVAIALLTIPTYVTGDAAAKALEGSEGVSKTLIETHEGAALLSLLFMEITGAFAWLALWNFRRTTRLSNGAAAVVLVFSLITLGLVSRAANIGGEIRHPEIRAAQETTTMEGNVARRVGAFVRDTPWAWPAFETLHFVGLSLLIGTILLVDLRMLGLMKMVSLGAVDRLLPWGMLGFGINVITGMLFFLGADYTKNVAFYWKLVFVVLAGLNTLYFTFDKAWAMAPGEDAPPLSKLVAATALFFWVGVMYWGSMLPFIGNAF
jgi:hypothetical protein